MKALNHEQASHLRPHFPHSFFARKTRSPLPAKIDDYSVLEMIIR